MWGGVGERRGENVLGCGGGVGKCVGMWGTLKSVGARVRKCVKVWGK